MIDLDLIRHKYASMSDASLISLAKDESRDLTDEALVLLKQEFSKRNLNLDDFINHEKEQAVEEESDLTEPAFTSNNNADNAMLGLSYQEMMYPPDKSKELNQNKEVFLEKLTEQDILGLIKKCDSSLIKSGLIFIVGIGVTLITLMNSINGGTYVVAWGAILFGGIGFFRALDSKSKLKTALKNINSQINKIDEPIA